MWEKTRLDLEWDAVLAALAARCRGPMGKRAALELPLAETFAEAKARAAESEEAARLAKDGEPLPAFDVPDVEEPLKRLRAAGVLGPEELRAVQSLLGAARATRRFLGTRKGRLPALFAACATDASLDDPLLELESSFDADGTLNDRASPELSRLRSEQRAARARILSRLEDLMGRYEKVLQERFVTEREGRYVLPVRSDAHERFPGLVHATSGSGSTLFVEPRAVIPMGNRLKVLDAEVVRAEIAVYTRLSTLLADMLPSLEAAREAVARADVLAATAKLAEDISLVFPDMVPEPRMDLRAARHPLLALTLPKVVPSDLAVSRGRAVVVSGPNAGGKTVALKSMGLAALMIRAGLPVACGEGSTLGFFSEVLTDVGDDQSLTKSLSTFSAHVANVTRILESTGPGTLVLLDELAGGTDPREGEALAAGILDSLSAREGAVVVTTHYEGLKALALADTRFENASVGFDLASMEPTFKVTVGIPGSSSALAVARRFGMPSTVIERAERFLSREDQSFETVVQKLHDERAALELARAAAERREQEAASHAARLEEELLAAKRREERVVSREAEAVLARLTRAKEDLHAAQAKLRQKKLDEREVKEAARAVERVASAFALGGELEPLVVPRAHAREREPLDPSRLKKGARVFVPRLRAEAEVLEVGPLGVRVRAGALKLTVAAAELESVDEAPRPSAATPKRDAGRGEARGEVRREVAIATSDNTCDLRGLRVDDALAMAGQFIDRSINEARSVAFLVHGHGTGALRDAVRRELRDNRFVAFFRPGTQDEGGDGVTVVWLA